MARNSTLLDTLRRWALRLVVLALVLAVVGGGYLAYRVGSDSAEEFSDPLAQFKYGSTGGDKNFGIPYTIWQVMPVLFKQYLPDGHQDEGWAAFGFIYAADAKLHRRLGRRRPDGT